MKFSIRDFFSKYDQIRSFLRIRSHLLKKSSMENFIFCVANVLLVYSIMFVILVIKQLHKQLKSVSFHPWNISFINIFNRYRRWDLSMFFFEIPSLRQVYVLFYLNFVKFKSYKCCAVLFYCMQTGKKLSPWPNLTLSFSLERHTSSIG